MSRLEVSAVMPVYNGEDFVAEALRAVLSQTRPPDEVIVVDDGSTDDTPAVLAGFGAEIRVVRQANAGVFGAMNRCFAEARMPYVAKCDADDVWVPTKLELQAEAAGSDAAPDVTFGEASVFGAYEGRWGMPLEFSARGPIDPATLGRVLFGGNPICPSTTFVRRALHAELGGFRDSRCEDYDFWMRALGAGASFFYDPTTVVNYRRHDANVSSNKLAVHESDLKVREENAHLVEDGVARTMLAEDHFKIGRDLADRGQGSEAYDCFRASLHQRVTPKAIAWAALARTPGPLRAPISGSLVSMKRALADVSR